MYIVNEICYAGECVDGIKIIEAKALKGRMLLVKFSTGEERLYDTTQLTGSAFDVLDDEEIFRNITLFHGIVTWNNGTVDIAPETIYNDSVVYEKEIA